MTGIPLRIRLRLFLRRRLPLVVWGAALALSIVTLRGRVAPAHATGLARDVTVPVASTLPGRLRSVVVGLHDSVAAGDVVATLDDTAARLEVTALLQEVGGLRAQIAAAEQELLLEASAQGTREADLRRRLALDIRDARLARIEEQGRRERDVAALQAVALRMERSRGLAGEALPQMELDTVIAEHDALEARIRGREATIEAWHAAEANAERRLTEAPADADPATEALTAPLDAAIRVAEARLEQAVHQADTLVLRAPVSGRVSTLLQRAGESVQVDEPVLRITPERTDEVIAWFCEGQLVDVEIGGRVELRRSSDPRAVGIGSIASRGPAVAPIPVHALADPTRPEYGVPVVVRSSDGTSFVPGERVAVRLAN